MSLPIAKNTFITEMGNGNRIILNHHDRDMTKTKIVFSRNSRNNTLVLDNHVTIKNSIIEFQGSNSVVFIDESQKNYRLRILICSNSLLYIGKNCFFNDFDNFKTYFFVYEHQNIIIGNGCVISFGCTFRNSDAHLIYDVNSSKRISESKSIVIGDHVWIGQNSLILKGTYIGSGAIIGANSVVSGKKVGSNSVWAGNPAKELRKGIYWLRTCCKNWGLEETIKYANISKKDEKFVYRYNPNESLIEDINDISIDTLLKDNKNRFAI